MSAAANLVCPDCLSVVREDHEACMVCGRTRPEAGWLADPLIGLVVSDRYRLEGRLGEGGMASVYRANRVGALGGHVAIKVLSPSLSRTVVARRFEREAQVVSQLTNPHVVRIYDFDNFTSPTNDQSLYYIAMELVNGQPLSGILRKQPRVSFLWAIDVLRQTARGLDEAHSLGIVHRDLKPSNIMIVQQRRATHVKILDFGIAAITGQNTGEQVEKLTRTGLVTGTPDYMAPEQAMGVEDMGPPVDMYALGVIAFQLFAGRLPFSGHTAMDVLTQRVSKPAPSLMSTCPPPALPPAIYNIVDRLLERDPAKRYQNAAELLDELAVFPTIQTTPDFVPDQSLLDQYANVTPAHGTHPVSDGDGSTIAGVAGVGGVQNMPTGIEQDSVAPKTKKSKAPLWIALAILLVGGGVGGFFIYQSSQGSAASGEVANNGKGGQAGGKAEVTLGKARPKIAKGFAAAATVVADGRTLVVSLPTDKPAIHKPLPLRLEVDFATAPLRLKSLKAILTMAGGEKVGEIKGSVNDKDGRGALNLVFPFSGKYELVIEYTLPDDTGGKVAFTYDTASGKLRPKKG